MNTETIRDRAAPAPGFVAPPPPEIRLYIQEMNMSVSPTVEPTRVGPPSLNRYITLKLLKLPTNWPINSGSIAFTISGIVIRLKFDASDAPSIREAS